MRITIADIAKELGISMNTVSKALNGKAKVSEEMKQRIIGTADRLGYKQNKIASRLAKKPIRICVLICGYLPEYYNETISGINEAYSELIDYKVKCDIDVLEISADTEKKAFEKLDEYASKGCDGIIINDLHSDYLTEKISELTEKNIKIALLNYDLPASSRIFASLNDLEMTGGIACELLGKLLYRSERKNVCVISGDLKSNAQKHLVGTFTKNAGKYDLDLILKRSVNDSAAELFGMLGQMDGIYVSCADCIPVCRHIRANKSRNKPALITSDIFGELALFIGDGTVDATIYQNPRRQGKNAIKNLYYAVAENRPIPDIIMTHPEIIVRSNIKNYI